MTHEQAADILEKHNRWRRYKIGDYMQMQSPSEIGKAIEVAIKVLKKKAK